MKSMESEKVNVSGVRFYLLSKQYWSDENGPLAASVTQVLSGGDGAFRKVM